jgi:hypothetical protein
MPTLTAGNDVTTLVVEVLVLVARLCHDDMMSDVDSILKVRDSDF